MANPHASSADRLLQHSSAQFEPLQSAGIARMIGQSVARVREMRLPTFEALGKEGK
jgi:hypothetical protein